MLEIKFTNVAWLSRLQMTIIFQTIAFVIAVRNSLCWREKKNKENKFLPEACSSYPMKSETAAILLRHDFTLLFPYSTAEMLVFLNIFRVFST